jgi:hypothetical protein
VGETRVDLLHLLEDLRDAYPGTIEETILTEVVANSLDSRAATIAITTDTAAAALTIVDDGAGMRRRELAHYHDIATSGKTRGEGIGFAGVGIKLGLLLSREVLTETRRDRHHVATSWGLVSRQRAPWRWVTPPGLVGPRGTAVRLKLQNVLSPLLDPGFVEGVLRRHFEPLLRPGFEEILVTHYPRAVAFVVNGQRVAVQNWAEPERAAIGVRLPRKRKPTAGGYLLRGRFVLPEERRGVAVSTFGKVIKRGWDWLGVTPAAPDRIGGLVEVPALAECLTLNKGDFVRSGPRGAIYLAHRKAIQEAVSRQLAEWGDGHDPDEHLRRRLARPLERDLEAVLADLAQAYPLLSTLVEQRAGGQRRLPIGDSSGPAGAGAATGLPADATPELVSPGVVEERSGPSGAEEAAPESGHPSELPPAALVRLPTPRGSRRPGHYGLAIDFESRPDDPELARLVESTVWVNAAHPAHRRAVASRSEGYHVALAVAMALAPLAVEPARAHGFVTSFLAAWGRGIERRRRR